MKTAKVTHCISCHHVIDAATRVEGGGNCPSPGSISICAYCGMIGVYTDLMDIRPMSAQELEEIRKESPQVYNMLMTGQRLVADRNRKN